ncbi:MAG: DNA repair protein RecO [Cytophagales bacterium]
MLHKTRGIVLGYISYKENSIIAKVYTEEFGLRSYIVNSVKSSKKGNKMAYFQSLSILEMVVYENQNKEIQRISELKLFLPFKSIPFHPFKIIIAMFLAELLIKCLKEESANSAKFSFLVEQIALFDQIKEHIEDFHIDFMLKLSSFLGFAPNQLKDFNSAGVLMDSRQSKIVNNLINFNKMPLNGADRFQLLELLIRYYQYHLDNFGAFKSVNVLREVVHN